MAINAERMGRVFKQVAALDGAYADRGPDRVPHRVGQPPQAARGYAPVARGMSAAVPFCDAFRSGHTTPALDEVLQAIGATA